MNGEPQTSWTQVIGWGLGALGWIVGIVSGLIQLKSYSDQRKLEKGYLNILEQAKRDWEGKYTEEQIRDLAQELARLEEKIRKEIPIQARRVFIEDQLANITDNIGELYSRRTELLKELKQQSNSPSLPPDLKSAIDMTIMPSYIARHRKQQIIYLLLIAVLALLVAVNYLFIMGILAARIPIKGSDIRVGFILWFGCVTSFVTYALSKLFKGRFRGWLMGGSLLSTITIALICFFSFLSLLILGIAGNEWDYEDATWEEWGGLSVVMLILSIPIAFLIRLGFNSLSTPISKLGGNSIKRKQGQGLEDQDLASGEIRLEQK